MCLSQELHHYVEEYVNVYEADDDEEWRLVISEVTAFMEVGMKIEDEFTLVRCLVTFCIELSSFLSDLFFVSCYTGRLAGDGYDPGCSTCYFITQDG